MSSSLSAEHLTQLVPLLGSLARLIAGGSPLSEQSLHTLLLGADLEANPAALAELQRWSRLLKAVQQQPTAEQRQATVEALLVRGLPEATVFLAVATVVGGAASPVLTPPAMSALGRLQASVANLDFGTLRSGQGAVLELDVQGGPGQVSVESDQLQVTPPQFGAGPTRLRVTVRPLTSGLLWTSLKLMTAGETLEVPVTAQWQATAAPSPLVQPAVSPVVQQSPPAVVAPLVVAGREASAPPMNPRAALGHEASAPPMLPPALPDLVPPHPNVRNFPLVPLVVILVVGCILIGFAVQAMQAMTATSVAQAATTTAVGRIATANTLAQAATATSVAQAATATSVAQAATATSVAQAATATSVARTATANALARAATANALAQAATANALAQAATADALAQAATAVAQAATADALAHARIPIPIPPPIPSGYSHILPNGGHLYRSPSREQGMALGLIWPGDEVLRLGEEFENINGRWIFIRVIKAASNRGDGGVPEGSEGYARATLISTP